MLRIMDIWHRIFTACKAQGPFNPPPTVVRVPSNPPPQIYATVAYFWKVGLLDWVAYFFGIRFSPYFPLLH